jgi:hypothetical protein
MLSGGAGRPAPYMLYNIPYFADFLAERKTYAACNMADETSGRDYKSWCAISQVY